MSDLLRLTIWKNFFMPDINPENDIPLSWLQLIHALIDTFKLPLLVEYFQNTSCQNLSVCFIRFIDLYPAVEQSIRIIPITTATAAGLIATV